MDPDKLDRVFGQVAANAEAGIYTHLSTYFPLWYRLREKNRIEGGRLGERPFALLICEPRFQRMYKAWLRELLTTENPYTGRTLAADPAVGIIEIQNEDSLFFWTFTAKNLGPGPWRRLEERFGAWLVERHGSLAEAYAAWGGAQHEHDDARTGRAGLYDAWFMTRDGAGKSGAATRVRLRAQIRFLGELQYAFYAEMVRYLRADLGYRGLVAASNWTTADNARLLGVERWTYTAADVIDRHGYFGGPHEGEGSNWSVRVGHTVGHRSALCDPAATPLGYLQHAGRPHLHSEVAWNKPNRYSAEHPLLLAAYGSLQGVDGYCLFSTHAGTWNKQATAKWPLMTPGVLGQSPAAALCFRRGDVATSEPVVRQVADWDGVLALDPAGLPEGRNDDFRLQGKAGPGDPSGFDPLTWFIGRVERVLTDLPTAPRGARPQTRDLDGYVDRRAETVRSVTGQLTWDWGVGVVRVDTPRCQAVAGFLAEAGRVGLGDVTIVCDNEYASVIVISLDGEDLAESRRILVQAFTDEHLHGYRESAGRITDLGQAPYTVAEVRARVTLPGGSWRATRLDPHGYPAGETTRVTDGFDLPTDALYTVLERDG